MSSRVINNRRLLVVILLLGLVHGLIYTFLIPPWQHYDEPTHFEVAWLLAHRPGWPGQQDIDLEMRRWVAQSMALHNFYRDAGGPPDLSDPDQPVEIGFSQLGDPKLYYLAASLPMRLFPESEVDLQLYAGRLVSLVFFLLTIVAARGLACELAPQGSPLGWMIPAALALLPGFVDLMTALNNDVGAIAAFSWFLWGGIRLLRRGFSWRDFFWCCAAIIVGIFMKRTTWIAVPLLGIPLIFSLLRGKGRSLAWIALSVAAFLLVFSLFSWEGVAAWYTRPAGPARQALADHSVAAPHGRYAFRVELNPDDRLPSPVQILPKSSVARLRGQTATLGAWIWVEPAGSGELPESISLQLPVLQDQSKRTIYSETVELSSHPRFFAFSFELPARFRGGWVYLTPLASTLDEGSSDFPHKPVTIFLDGVVLAEGLRPAEDPPVFTSEDCLEGQWGGRPFTNLLRNGSAETSGLQIRPWVERFGSFLFPDYGYDRPSLALYTLLDFAGTGTYYRAVAVNLLETFWAKFGWGHVRLIGATSYHLLAGLTLLGIVGAFLALIKSVRINIRSLPGALLLFLGLTVISIWGMAFIRGSNYIFIQPYYPVARYAYPAIIPTLVLLCIGWLNLANMLRRLFKLPSWLGLIAFFSLFAVLDVWSLISLIDYYALF